MSDLIHQAHKAKILAVDASLPKWQRLCQGLEAFSGFELSSLAEGVAKQIEANLVRVNEVMAGYRLAEIKDYESIADADLEPMIDMLARAATRAIDAELDRIVADLDEGFERLPVEALREAREHRALVVPRLIEALQNAASAARRGELPDGNLHFFAVFLLTEFQAEEAFPVIREAFSLPGELPFDLFGDAVTCTFARILAQFAGERPEVVDALIRDSQLNEYVRWEAAQCYVHLVRDGRFTREEALERLREHLQQAIAERDEAIVGGLICVMVSFAPGEALEEIKEAYRLDLVDECLVGLGTVERGIAEGEARVRQELARCAETGIADTIGELRTWASFAEKPTSQPRPSSPPPQPDFAAAPDPADPLAIPGGSHGPKVGRNDRCPCGSGKKFKKCCGSRR